MSLNELSLFKTYLQFTVKLVLFVTLFLALIHKSSISQIQNSCENSWVNLYMSVRGSAANLSCFKILQNQNFIKISWHKINVLYSIPNRGKDTTRTTSTSKRAEVIISWFLHNYRISWKLLHTKFYHFQWYMKINFPNIVIFL